MKIQHTITALITPMLADKKIDEKGYKYLLEAQIKGGVKGVVPMGTTGSSATLSHQEHIAVVKLCVEAVDKRLFVIAGAGSNNTKEAVELAQKAQEVGADAVLSVAPYYNKPSQEGLYQHFKMVAQETDIPIVLYNIPGRSIVDISNKTIVRLVKDCPSIIGVKDATSDLGRATFLRGALGDDFVLLSGDDMTMSGYLAQGGQGVISVVSNIAPRLCAQLFEAWDKRDMESFAKTRSKLYFLSKAMFCASSPAPVKYAASLLGLCEDYVRLPIVPLSDDQKIVVKQAMITAGLLEP